jgi:hypothetical protein
MGLRAFTRDGVIRAGFGFFGTFYNVICRFKKYPTRYKISGLNYYFGNINNINDATLHFSLNNTTFTNPLLLSNSNTCLETNMLFWQKPLSELNPAYVGGSVYYFSLYYTKDGIIEYTGGPVVIPAGSWVLEYSTGSAIYRLGYAVGSKYRPPRSGYILNTRLNTTRAFCTGNVLVT